MSKPTYVLGTGLSHDGSACLIADGRVVVAIEKERLTRRKHDGDNDSAAIEYCLQAARISIDDVSLVVQNANFSMFATGNDWFVGPRIIRDHPHVVTISHHLAHAFSALGTCPFDECAVLVVDGCGNAFDEAIDKDGATLGEVPPPGAAHLYFEKDSYYAFVGGRSRTVYKDFSPWGLGFRDYPMHPPTTQHSIGGLYAAASIYALFGMEDPGKLMGLAPYGNPDRYDGEIFELRDGRVFVRYDWMREFRSPTRSYEHFRENFQYYADIAAWVQREVERALLYLVRARYERFPSENLSYAGGVALNAVANRQILRHGPFRNVYFQPAAGDNGLALGCAFYGWLEVLGRERVRHDGSTSFGRSYGRRTVRAAVGKRRSSVGVESTRSWIRRAAELISEGKTVGWFVGGGEFGPRALGHRSILADPSRGDMRDHINARVKFREDFRPFAPAVTAEDARRYFVCEADSPYMLLVTDVRPEHADRLRGVIHRDGSARLQTVTEAANPPFYRLLKELQRISGVPVVLNTSLNRKGTPIVETPAEALEFLLETELDALVFEGFVLQKRRARRDAFDAAQFVTRRLAPLVARRKQDCPEEASVELVVKNGMRFTIDFSRRGSAVRARPHAPARCSVEIDDRDLKMLAGDPSRIETYFSQDKVRIRGDSTSAMLFLDSFKRIPPL